MFTILLILAWLGAAGWLIFSASAIFRIVALKTLSPLPAATSWPEGERPLVSVLVPARNEAGRALDACLRSLLAQDYGRVEVIAVDDCSTDATGAVLHNAAKTNRRLRVIDGVNPPPSWLGKPYALQQAFDASRGQWILMTDADVIFSPESVRTALTHALSRGDDALTLIPRVECLSFWERVFMPTCWGVMMLAAMPPDRVNDPRRKTALGIGNFFLVRRGCLEKIGGLGAVRSEVLEDVRLAERLKESGARLRIERAPRLVRTRMLTSFGDVWRSFSKNMFAAMKFSFPKAMFGAVAVFACAVVPAIVAAACLFLAAAGVPGEWGKLFVPVFTTWLIQVCLTAYVNRDCEVPAVYALTVPLNYALFSAILFNSTIRVTTGRGVTWKGRTLYRRPESRQTPSRHSEDHLTSR